MALGDPVYHAPTGLPVYNADGPAYDDGTGCGGGFCAPCDDPDPPAVSGLGCSHCHADAAKRDSCTPRRYTFAFSAVEIDTATCFVTFLGINSISFKLSGSLATGTVQSSGVCAWGDATRSGNPTFINYDAEGCVDEQPPAFQFPQVHVELRRTAADTWTLTAELDHPNVSGPRIRLFSGTLTLSGCCDQELVFTNDIVAFDAANYVGGKDGAATLTPQ